MTEAAFRKAVCSNLPKFVHRQPNVASFHSYPGTPDSYFDYHSDLWCEFKFMANSSLPKQVPTCAMPTDEQVRWLNRRYYAGGNALAIVGIKIKHRMQGFVLCTPEEWSERPLLSFYEPRLRLPLQLAQYIEQRITCPDSRKPLLSLK